MNDWEQVVESFLNTAEKHGLKLLWVYDGMEDWPTPTAKEAAETICAVDCDCTVGLSDGDYCHHVLLVLGNSPDELVADYTFSQKRGATKLEAACADFESQWADKPVPVKVIDNTHVTR